MLLQADQKQSKNPVDSKLRVLCMLEALIFGKPSGPCLSEVETGQRPTQWIEKKGSDSAFQRSDSTYKDSDSAYKGSNFALKGSDSTYKRSDFAKKQFFYASKQPDLTSSGPNIANKQLVVAKKRSGFTDKRSGFADKHSGFTDKQSAFAQRRKPTFEKRPLGSYFARYPSLLGFLEKYLATRNVIVTLETPDKDRSQQENEAMAKREKDRKELDEVVKFRVATKISGTGISYKCRLYPNACNKIYSYHL